MRARVRSVVILSAVLLAGLAANPAWAQPDAPPGVPPSMASRLAADRLSAIQPGIYSSGEKDSFTLHRFPGGKYLLRFSGASESFVLSVERGSLGTKLLKVCESRLKDAELKIELLKKQKDGASFSTFEPERGA